MAVSCMDFTSLDSRDDAAKIQRLAIRAREAGVACVCVYPVFAAIAADELKGAPVKVAAVAGAFPHGLSAPVAKLSEIAYCRVSGATEIDVPISHHLAVQRNWRALYDDLASMRTAAGDACLKVILSAAFLDDDEAIYQTALVALMAGADFVKTSTGKDGDAANLQHASPMFDAIWAYRQRSGFVAGFKAAGGIRTADAALQWMRQIEEGLGSDWLNPSLTRIGASSLLDEVENTLAKVSS